MKMNILGKKEVINCSKKHDDNDNDINLTPTISFIPT